MLSTCIDSRERQLIVRPNSETPAAENYCLLKKKFLFCKCLKWLANASSKAKRFKIMHKNMSYLSKLNNLRYDLFKHINNANSITGMFIFFSFVDIRISQPPLHDVASDYSQLDRLKSSRHFRPVIKIFHNFRRIKHVIPTYATNSLYKVNREIQ